MSDITQLLDGINRGNSAASAQLLPILYKELRAMASQHMRQEKPGQTLQPTALVHEAYLRLVGNQHFDTRGHFIAAASQAMRRILVENARRKQRIRHGGQMVRQSLDMNEVAIPGDDIEMLALHNCLDHLALEQPRRAQIVELRFFGGMSLDEAAAFLGISLSTAARDWRYARAWLNDAIEKHKNLRTG